MPHEYGQEKKQLGKHDSAYKDYKNRGQYDGQLREDVCSHDSCRMSGLLEFLEYCTEGTSGQQCLCGRIAEFRLRSIRNADSKELTQRSPGDIVVDLE